MLRILATAAVIACASATYRRVIGERCDVLANATAFFDVALNDCAEFDNVNVDLACLTAEEVAAAMLRLPDWTLANAPAGDSISRTYLFADFRDAFFMVAQSAQLFEANDHHALLIVDYNMLTATWTTDNLRCLSSFDVEGAHGQDVLYDLGRRR